MKSIKLAALAFLAFASAPCAPAFAETASDPLAASAPAASDAAQETPAEGKPLIFLVPDGRPPYQLKNADGRFNGFDIDVAYNLARYLGRKAEVFVVDRDEMFRRLEAGEADAAIGVEPHGRHDKRLDFSSPVLVNKIRLFVHEETVFIHTLKDLHGVRVGLNKDADIREFLKLIPGVRIVVEPDTSQALKDLAERKITVYIGDEHECQYYIRTERLTGIKTIGGALMLKRRAIAVKKGQDELLEKIEAAVEAMKKDRALNAIYENWFGVPSLAGHLQRKFLTILLVVLGVVATVLLISLIWNQRLSDAVAVRTQELAAERAHFQNIFDHASDGIMIVNPDDTSILEANRAVEDIFGFSKHELFSLRLSDLDVSEDRAFTHHLERTLGSGGENALFESRLRGKYGQPMDLLIHARAFPYKGRTMVEAIVRDITERKKIQEMKDTILQDVAHELKTPMAKMAMSIDLLERNLSQKDRESYSKFFEICHRSIQRLMHTIDGILNLSRLESQATKMDQEVFSINEVAASVVEELTVFAQKKGIALVADLPKDPLRMKGDAEMIRRLLINVIQNAIKFTDKGAVRVSAAEDKYKLVKISVKDDGIGLEEQDLKKIFSRFYQKTPTSEGSGIGLTISQKIVSLHNGVIWAESEGLGRGTTMNMMFPLYTGAAAPAAA